MLLIVILLDKSCSFKILDIVLDRLLCILSGNSAELCRIERYLHHIAHLDVRVIDLCFVKEDLVVRVVNIHNVHNFLEYPYIELSCNRVDIHSDILAVRIILLDSLFDT